MNIVTIAARFVSFARRRSSMNSLRWSVNYGRWTPSADQWIYALSLVEPQERKRIKGFVFRRDAKAALVGRLLIRKAAAEMLGIPYRDICLGRTDKQKPYLMNDLPAGNLFEFNVSHQGDYAILAAELRTWTTDSMCVGVDIMDIQRPYGARTAKEFFETMKRQFTEQEWIYIQSDSDDEMSQLARFYRFEESMLDDNHIICVATNFDNGQHTEDDQSSSPIHRVISFTELYLEDLLSGTVPQREQVYSDWEDFSVKAEKPSVLSAR